MDLDNEFGFAIILPSNVVGEERSKILVNLSWMLRCFVSAVADSYAVGAPRREQACSMVETYAMTLRPQLNENEWYQFRKGLLDDASYRCYLRYNG